MNPIIPRTIEGIDLNKLREQAQDSNSRRGKPPPPFESWFEVDVYLDILDRGFLAIPQYEVAGYFIDLVVEAMKSRLAVECDGDEWHGIEQYERDVARQRILERCGWRFFRIRGHEYYRDPIKSLEPLWKTLKEMGIEPLRSSGFDKSEPSQDQQQLESTKDIVSNHELVNELKQSNTESMKKKQISETTAPPDDIAQQLTIKET